MFRAWCVVVVLYILMPNSSGEAVVKAEEPFEGDFLGIWKADEFDEDVYRSVSIESSKLTFSFHEGEGGPQLCKFIDREIKKAGPIFFQEPYLYVRCHYLYEDYKEKGDFHWVISMPKKLDEGDFFYDDGHRLYIEFIDGRKSVQSRAFTIRFYR